MAKDKKTGREFIRDKRRHIKVARKALNELRWGCALRGDFDGTLDFCNAVYAMSRALDEIDRITKPLR